MKEYDPEREDPMDRAEKIMEKYIEATKSFASSPPMDNPYPKNYRIMEIVNGFLIYDDSRPNSTIYCSDLTALCAEIVKHFKK